MQTLLNESRPAMFCPGCTHEVVVKALNSCLLNLGLTGDQVAIVSDIGCSGLFDTFFSTNAIHGLHGRALTYSTGLKLARPELKVVTVMGDGGLGIGGAHLLASCRRNLDITLLVLNNFNYGMTGGQFSCTSPSEAKTSSGFLNRLEAPMDVCEVAAAAGAAHVTCISGLEKALPQKLEEAVQFNGFSIVDIWSVCPGRYGRNNRLTATGLKEEISRRAESRRSRLPKEQKEYGAQYRYLAGDMNTLPELKSYEKMTETPYTTRQEIVILGAAGQYVNTTGELLCVAGILGGMHATLKSDYPITVLRGFSNCELILDSVPVSFTGIQAPSLVLCLAPEGVSRSSHLFGKLSSASVVVRDKHIELPPSAAGIIDVDFERLRISKAERGTASLAYLAREGLLFSRDLLEAAVNHNYEGELLGKVLAVIDRVFAQG